MPDPGGIPDPPLDEVDGQSNLLVALSREMVKAHKKYYGKGPIKSKAYLMDDLCLIVLRGGQTTAEAEKNSSGSFARRSKTRWQSA